ncbi:MAG TPA: MBL fold metallo-hydrolase [Planctomycetaceae bacterium]|nr:MBL fold metallo-hydrolase [Planctomycetaceae bacterium]
MTSITEIARDVYRLSTYVPEFDLQFNQFVVKDDEPLLYHTGPKAMFPSLLEAVGRILEPSAIRWISFSHFEADECGALNQWLEVAPSAEPVCTFVGAVVNINDFAVRPAHVLEDGEVLNTGEYRYRLLHTPHLPHGWDAGMLFEETQRTLFCSDLFHQVGDVEPSTESDVIGRFRAALTQYQVGPLRNYMPYTPNTGRFLTKLAAWQPKTLAAMHGSSFLGDGEKALLELEPVLKELLGS